MALTEAQHESLSKHYTEDELNGLSDDEKEALLDGTDEEREALNKIIGDDDDKGSGAGDGAGDENGAVDGAGDGAGDESGAGNEDGESEDRADFVPTYRAPPVDNFDEQMADLDAKFESGDIQLKEYNSQRDALNTAKIKADIASEQQEQFEEQLWDRQINDFMDDHKEYRDSKLRHAALDTAVKDLAAKEENANKTGVWFLREAHKLVQAEFGAMAKPGNEDTGKDKGDGKKEDRKPNKEGLPPNLGKAPAAAGNDTDASEFASLDKLEGLEYERALARLSPAERERYLAS